MDDRDLMVTLIFGSAALLVGIYYIIASYASGFKDVYGRYSNRTLFDVIAKTLMVHIFLVITVVAFINSFEILSGLDIYAGIKRLLHEDWWAVVRNAGTGEEDVKTIALLLGWIKLITIVIIAMAPVFLFFGIVVKEVSSCHNSQENHGIPACFYKIVFPALIFLTVLIIHFQLSSVLLTGFTGDREFLRNLSTQWWDEVIVGDF